MPAKQSKLAELVCSAYREDGLQPLPTGRKVKPRLWTRPPLYTNLKLRGELLQPYVEVQCDLGLDELLDVYETFIAGFVMKDDDFTDIESDDWLGSSLHLAPSIARMLFAPPFGGVRGHGLHLLANIIQFAALVSYNFPHTTLVTEDAFVVRVSDTEYGFGVMNRTFVSNMYYELRDTQKLPATRMFRGSLWELPRSAARRRHTVTIHDRLAYWAESQPEAEALQLALAILWWRNCSSSGNIFHRMFKPEKSKPPIEDAVHRGRKALDSENPLTALRDVFVPSHMLVSEFIARFASPYRKLKLPLSEEMRAKFERSLDQLSQ